jgi:prophage DNA circulation protein
MAKDDQFAKPSTANADELKKLLGCTFRGISIPLKDLTTSGSHDIAQHKFADRDGARVESTGRNPIEISGSAIFVNTIFPGGGESWVAGKQYPENHRSFLAALADKSIADFQHPSLGLLKVKVESFSSKLSGDRRGGEEIDFKLIETLEGDTSAFETSLQKPVQSTKAVAAADAIDSLLNRMDPPPPIVKQGISLGELAREIRGVVDQAKLTRAQVGAKIDFIQYQLQTTADSVRSLNSITNSDLMNKLRELQGTYINVKDQYKLGDGTKQVYKITSPVVTTFGALAVQLHNSVSDLIALNPELAKSPKIPAYTEIRYY